MRPPPHSNYRADIDGLRAVAVLPVVAFHTFPTRFGGGFIGVDIFFVISGYLISGIILGGLEKQKFSFREFYARRIKRIFPTLVLVFATCMILGWVLLLGGEYKQLGKHVAGGAAFVSNFVLWGEAGYFDSAAESKVLLHLWSLGIEEQFYLLWPLCLFFASRKRWLTPVLLVGLLLASFTLNVVRVRTDPVGTFYSPTTRFWELFVGAFLAWVSLHKPKRLRWMIGAEGATLRSFVGLALIGSALVVVRTDKAFPGFWALLPVVGAAFLISAGPDAWCNKHILSNRLMVFVGLISYPLYVWHWPLLIFEHFFEYGSYSWQVRVAAVALAFVLAWLTARFVEGPIRTGLPKIWKVAVPAVAMATLFILGALTYRNDGYPLRLKDMGEYEAYFDNTPPEYRYFHAHDVPRTYRFDCDFYDADTKRAKSAPVDASCYTPHSEKKVVLWGDSHAQQFYYGLSVTLPSDVSLLPFASSGCYPSVDPAQPDTRGYCTAANAYARQHIRELKPDVVILAQASSHEDTDFDGIIAWLGSVGVKHVVLIGPVPQWHPDLYKVIARHYWAATPERLNTYLVKKVFDTDRLLHTRSAGRPFTFVSIIDQMCNADGCIVYLDGDRKEGLITNDYGHLTTKGSVFVAKTILAPVITSLL
jgi:peptidoglycan/LPS O-acetylase OafA/YrhL